MGSVDIRGMPMMVQARARSRIVRLAQAMVASALPLAVVPPAAADAVAVGASGLQRGDEAVVVPGNALSGLHGVSVSELGVFRFDRESLSFVPVPFQVDERLPRTFLPGTPFEFTQIIHDVRDEDDGLLDALDEIAFLYKDADDRAPSEVPWPAGAGPYRYEVAIKDPRPEVTNPPRWIYIFSGPSLPRDDRSYVSWNGLEASTISTEFYDLDYDGPWLLTGLRVHPPCGTGLDLVDRFKGRAGVSITRSESEETWNETATYIGGYAGPVRAVRYVLGAASAVSTVHHDIVTPSRLARKLDLRVHPINQFWFYADWVPDAELTFYAPDHPQGLALDGVEDEAQQLLQDWTVTRGPQGGAIIIHEIPPSPYFTSKGMYFRDDESFDDAPRPGYSDEDDAAWGNHGFWIFDLKTSYDDVIDVRMSLFPLCAGEGSVPLGEEYDEIDDHPFEIEPEPQHVTVAPIRTLSTRADSGDVVLEWEPALGAIGYRVYAAERCDTGDPPWEPVGETGTTVYRDAGAAQLPGNRCYSVVGVGSDGNEGEW
jgi:hypothetical protein